MTASTGAVPATPVFTGFKDDQYNAPQIFYIGTDQHVHHLYTVCSTRNCSSGPNSWGSEDLTALTGATLATTDLTSFKDVQYNAQQVFYIGIDQHVYHFFGVPGTPWGVEDLTAKTGAVAARSGLSGFKDVQYNAQQLFYIGTDEDVHHFYGVPGTPWGVEDLTADTGAVPAASGPSSFNDVDYNAQQVFYIGTDQDVHHIYGVPGAPWTVEDITARTGVSAAGVGLSTYKNEQYNSQEVFYTGTDQHVHHFWGVPGNPWYAEDLSALTGAAQATTAPTGIYDMTANLQSVFYLGGTHVYHFFAIPGNPWNVEDVTASTGGLEAIGSYVIGWVDTTVTISGHVTAGGIGVSDVAVSLTGTSRSGDSISLTTTTDPNGNYSFSVPFGGTYTVTAMDAIGAAFSPDSVTFKNVTANQVGEFRQ